jgi:hypothetical protein
MRAVYGHEGGERFLAALEMTGIKLEMTGKKLGMTGRRTALSYVALKVEKGLQGDGPKGASAGE